MLNVRNYMLFEILKYLKQKIPHAFLQEGFYLRAAVCQLQTTNCQLF